MIEEFKNLNTMYFQNVVENPKIIEEFSQCPSIIINVQRFVNIGQKGCIKLQKILHFCWNVSVLSVYDKISLIFLKLIDWFRKQPDEKQDILNNHNIFKSFLFIRWRKLLFSLWKRPSFSVVHSKPKFLNEHLLGSYIWLLFVYFVTNEKRWLKKTSYFLILFANWSEFGRKNLQFKQKVS